MQISRLLAALVVCRIFPIPVVLAQSAKDQAALAAMATDDLKKLPAKKLFGAQKVPARPGPAPSVLCQGLPRGGKALPVDGPAWQVMRTVAQPQLGPSRPGQPWSSAWPIEAKQKDGWNGLLVGDLAQPRGGPMLTGHASHQMGLDADVWFTPMPDRMLTAARSAKTINATVVMVKDRKSIEPGGLDRSPMPG